MKLEEVIDRTLATIKERGYTEKTWKLGFRNGRFSCVREYFAQMDTDEFSVDIAKGYIAATQERYNNGELSYSRCAHLKKKAACLIEVYETSNIKWKSNTKEKYELNEYFKKVLDDFLIAMNDCLSLRSVQELRYNCMYFLDYLKTEKSYESFENLDAQDVNDFIVFRLQQKGNVSNTIYYAKRFLKYLNEQNITPKDLSVRIPKRHKKSIKILPCFSRSETEKILAQPDKETAIGKRDYAIFLLARDTGLRRTDIVNLMLTDIDWEQDTLCIIQSKTSESLVLPLKIETEYAIADYIRNARPKTDTPNIFIRQNAPYLKLSPQNIGAIFDKYIAKTNIVRTPYDGKTFHALRRTIAVWMLEAGISLEMIFLWIAPTRREIIVL